MKMKYSIPRTICKYCNRDVSQYYLPIHQTSKRCFKIQEKVKRNAKIIRDIIDSNTDEYELNRCMLCSGKIIKKAKQRDDENIYNYNKLHKKCLHDEILKSNEKNFFEIKINSCIDL
jgi:uncharacterized protein with PIN domain